MTAEPLLISSIPSYDQHGYSHYTWGYIYTRRSPKVKEFAVRKSSVPLRDIYGMFAAEKAWFKPVYAWEEDKAKTNTIEDKEPLLRLKLVCDLADGIRLYGSQYDKGINFILIGEHETDLETLAAWILEHFPKEEETSDAVPYQFVFTGEFGADSHDRDIITNSWEEIRGNYSPKIHPQLDELMDFKPDESSAGKIGILLGPPGTGKTHLIRTLSRSWRSWANFKYVLDVERFFTDAGYMLDVVLKTTDEDKWNVILCEDAEEYIAPEAKDRIGQALARLLNIGDGLIGQGLRIILLFTTNAPDARLHQAITRAGRCFSRVNVPLLTAAESAQWLKEHDGPLSDGEFLGSQSLAQLYARVNEANQQIVTEEDKRPAGFGPYV